MLAFLLILFTYSRRLDFEELQSLNSVLFNYNNKKLTEDDLEEKLDELEEEGEENSDKYALLVDNAKQDEPNFQSVISNNSSCTFYAFSYKQKKVVLSYHFQQQKCINKLKLKIPENLPQDNKCNWINGFKNTILLGKKKLEFNGEWISDKCIKTQEINITSTFPKLAANEIVCFGELEVNN